MAPEEQTTASPTSPSATPPTMKDNSLGLKAFNRTGQEETTSDVMRPVRVPGSRGRNFALYAIVLIAAFIMLSFAYQQSGLPFFPTPDEGRSFGNASTEHNVDRAE